MDDNEMRTDQRNENVKQRRFDQSYQASKMIRMNRRAGFKVHKGQSVALFADPRDRATHSRLGIHCLIIDVTTGAYPSVRLVIPEGIIGDKQSKTSIWFTHDKYNLLDASSPLGPERRLLRQQILDKSFDPTKYKIISVREAHRVTYSKHHSIKKHKTNFERRKIKCNCKRLGLQCKTNTCGCRKAGILCTHLCKCNKSDCMNRHIHGVVLEDEVKAGNEVPKNQPTV